MTDDFIDSFTGDRKNNGWLMKLVDAVLEITEIGGHVKRIHGRAVHFLKVSEPLFQMLIFRRFLFTGHLEKT